MTQSSEIEILDNLIDGLDNRIKLDGQKVYQTSTFVDPWEKGNLKNYLILSALLVGPRTHQLRIKYQSKTGTFSSKCDCQSWNEKNHCQHVYALLLYYRSSRNSMAHVDNERVGPAPEDSNGTSHGVYPSHYGTLVEGANRLEGSIPRSIFSSVYYRLDDGRTIRFPVVTPWEGHLRVNFSLIDPDRLSPHQKTKGPLYYTSFSYTKPDGETEEKISIFNYLYLFDWVEGKCLELPNQVKEFVKKILSHHNKLTFDQVGQISSYFLNRKEELIKFEFQGTSLEDYHTSNISFQITINNSSRKNHLELRFEFHDEDKVKLPPPPPFQLMAFEGGHLNSFRKKGDGYNFLNELSNSLKGEENQLITYVRMSESRSRLEEIIGDLKEYEKYPEFHLKEKRIFLSCNKLFAATLEALIESFDISVFRFSEIYMGDLSLRISLPQGQLLEGVYVLYEKLSSFGIPIFYNNTRVSTWNSTVKFSRSSSSSDWFDLNMEIENNDLAIINSGELDKSFVVTDKGLTLFTPEQKNLLKFLKRYTGDKNQNNKINDGKETKLGLVLQRSRIFELFELHKLGILGALTPEEIEFCEKLKNLEEMPNYPVPSGYGDISRKYQNIGFSWLRFLHENKLGACLADDMGLGKTLQTIMFVHSIIEKVERVLIVCPVSIIINWQKEFEKFSDLKTHVYYGDNRNMETDAKIIITSYGIMKREFENVFSQFTFDILVLDEVQHLKNARSIGAGVARRIKANYRICLTGTPVENDLSEFYNIMDLAIPGIWGSVSNFKTTSEKKTRLLAKQTARPFILRRTKDQVLTDLPEKIENTVYLNFNENEKNNYNNALTRIQDTIRNPANKNKYGQILKGILELRQLCLWQRNSYNSTKIEFLMENLIQILEEGHQIIVFSQFTSYLDTIEKRFNLQNWKFSRIDGSKSFTKRQEEVERFQSGETKLFLISLRAGGVGLNLTAASYIFIMDPWWNPAVEQQAIDRAHRIGQSNKVNVYRPVIKNSVEEKVLQLQQSKRELFNDLLGNEEDNYFTGKLTMEDFRHLLEL